MKKFNRFNITATKFSWQPTRNIGLTLGAALRRVVALREGGLTRNWCSTALYFGRYVAALQRAQGWRGVVIRLKAMSVLLQQSAGGQKLDNPRKLGCAVARSRNGIPRVIPVGQRKAIRSGDRWTIRIWASFFWLYRVIEIPSKVKLDTITRPSKVNYLIIMEWVRWLVLFFPVFLELIGREQDSLDFSKKRRSSPLSRTETSSLLQLLDKPLAFVERLTALWAPHMESSIKDSIPRKERKNLIKPYLIDLQPQPLMLLNSGPNSAKSMDEAAGPRTRTSIGSILTDMYLWSHDPEGLWPSIRNLWPKAAAFAQTCLAQAKSVFKQLEAAENELGSRIMGEFGTWSRSETGDIVLPGFSQPWGLGKLGFIPEPAGKMRVVAMLDSLTQMLLRPLHDAVFGILRKIPQDGTFDQYKPAKILAFEASKLGVKSFWSYDLSAATDRFPVSLQQALLGLLIGPKVAQAWREVLTSRSYMVKSRVSSKQKVPKGTPSCVKYMAGQPMGGYTSWAVFALTHHFLVQFAHYQAFGVLRWFHLYALLGDDVVIAERAVAEKYLLLLRAIGVEVGLAKSLISDAGVFEFAKRTFRTTEEGLLTDISGISLDAIGASITDPSVGEALLTHCGVRTAREGLKILARILGYGFKARSRFGGSIASMNSRLGGLALLLTRPSSVWGLPFTEWLLQATVEVPGQVAKPVRDQLEDAVRQRLVSLAQKYAMARLRVLQSWGIPVDNEGNLVSQLTRFIPHFLREDHTGVHAPLYEAFLAEWVFSPLLDKVRADLAQLLTDINLWRETDLTEGDFSLDEIYTSLNDLIDELSSIDAEVDLFIRRESDKEGKRLVRRRSGVLRLWHALRRMVEGNLTR